MAKKYIWIPSPAKAKRIKITEEQKNIVNIFFEPLIVEFKKHLKVKPNKEHNYVVDIYSKWYQNYFYFCEKYKAEYKNRIMDEFETKFVRIEFVSENKYTFSYFRHTGQWHVVVENITLRKCLEMIKENPNFQPLY